MMFFGTGSLSDNPWFRAGALVAISLAVAYFFVFMEEFGGPDWHNYIWAADTALQGKNPYLEWGRIMATIPSDRWPGRCDLPPLQLLVYMGCLKLAGPPALYALFAMTHAVTAVLIDRIGARLRCYGLTLLAIFYAVFPLFTYWFLQVSSNKNIMTLLAVLLIILAARADRHLLEGDGRRSGIWTWLALLVAVLLGNFGWLGFAALPIIILSSGWSFRKMALAGAVASVLSLLLHLPYFPDWKVMYLFRFFRVTLPSFHTSPLRLVDALLGYFGLKIPLQVPLLALIVAVLAWYAWRYRGNAARSSALAMITMAMVRTDADPPTALMSLVITLVALQQAPRYLYLLVMGALIYSQLTTAHALYATASFTANILVPLVIAVPFLVREQIGFTHRARSRAQSGRLAPAGE